MDAPEALDPSDTSDDSAERVAVRFDVTPAEAVVAVRAAEASEPIAAEADGSFLLCPGEYVYSAGAEGYAPVEAIPFTVADEPLTISVALMAIEAEPVGFDQSQTIDGVVVTVRADPGVFPADAALSVERVPVYQQAQADAAVEEVRDEGQTVAVSYTFDIKVVNPDTGEEYQPAEGQTVNVSFALAEVADENLDAQVYHVTEDEATGEMTAEALEVTTDLTPEAGDGAEESAPAVTVETDGFSIYQVEFTYNKLEYVLPGGASVPMSEILAALGLTGEVAAVEISDTGLFSASNENGVWTVTAHCAFSTTPSG